jgi:hypothetical protein
MKRQDILKALKAVMSGVEKATKTMGMDYITFDNSWIRSFKDSISVSYPLVTELKVSVRGDELFKVLSKMKNDDITLSIEEDKFLITDGKTTLKLNTLQQDQVDQIFGRIDSLKTDELEWYELPKFFINGLSLCVFSAGTDPALNLLAGVHVEDGFILSTDNYRISKYEMEGAVISPFTIPTKVADEFTKLPVTFENIALTKSWVHLSDKEGAIFSARLLAGDYPVNSVTTLFDKMKFEEGEVYTLPGGIEKSLDIAGIMASAGSGELEFLSYISLSYKEEKLIISAVREIGELEDTIDWKEKYMPEGFIVKISPDFLSKIIKVTRDFQISPTKKTLLFSTDVYKHIMIVKVE